MTHDEHMLTPDQVRDRVASAATRTVEPGRVSVLERLQQERDTSARLADQVNELGEEAARLRAENNRLKAELAEAKKDAMCWYMTRQWHHADTIGRIEESATQAMKGK